MCWATSHAIVREAPSRCTSTVSAVLISGSSSGGNSTSTTGPITRTTRPSGCSSAISLLQARAGEGLRPADDLHDLGGDLVLPGAVRLPGQDLHQLLGVVGRGLHRASAGGVLR